MPIEQGILKLQVIFILHFFEIHVYYGQQYLPRL